MIFQKNTGMGPQSVSRSSARGNNRGGYSNNNDRSRNFHQGRQNRGSRQFSR